MHCSHMTCFPPSKLQQQPPDWMFVTSAVYSLQSPGNTRRVWGVPWEHYYYSVTTTESCFLLHTFLLHPSVRGILKEGHADNKFMHFYATVACEIMQDPAVHAPHNHTRLTCNREHLNISKSSSMSRYNPHTSRPHRPGSAAPFRLSTVSLNLKT